MPEDSTLAERLWELVESGRILPQEDRKRHFITNAESLLFKYGYDGVSEDFKTNILRLPPRLKIGPH